MHIRKLNFNAFKFWGWLLTFSFLMTLFFFWKEKDLLLNSFTDNRLLCVYANILFSWFMYLSIDQKGFLELNTSLETISECFSEVLTNISDNTLHDIKIEGDEIIKIVTNSINEKNIDIYCRFLWSFTTKRCAVRNYCKTEITRLKKIKSKDRLAFIENLYNRLHDYV